MTDVRGALLQQIKDKAVVHGKVTLSSGLEADYYVDLRRVTLDGEAAPLVGQVLLDLTAGLDFDAVGGLTMGADPLACAALAGGADVKAFFVRKETKAHGLQRRIEGPDLDAGDRCLIVEDVVTTGGSTVQAIEAVRGEGHDVCGVITVLDRLAGGSQAMALASGDAPYPPLTPIDDVTTSRLRRHCRR